MNSKIRRQLLTFLLTLLLFPFITAAVAIAMAVVLAIITLLSPIIVTLLSLWTGGTIAKKMTSSMKPADHLTFASESIWGVTLANALISLLLQPILFVPVALVFTLVIVVTTPLIFIGASIYGPYEVANYLLHKKQFSQANSLDTNEDLLNANSQKIGNNIIQFDNDQQPYVSSATTNSVNNDTLTTQSTNSNYGFELLATLKKFTGFGNQRRAASVEDTQQLLAGVEEDDQGEDNFLGEKSGEFDITVNPSTSQPTAMS